MNNIINTIIMNSTIFIMNRLCSSVFDDRHHLKGKNYPEFFWSTTRRDLQIIVDLFFPSCWSLIFLLDDRHYLKGKDDTELFEVQRRDLDIIIDRFPILKERLLAVGSAVTVKLSRALQVFFLFLSLSLLLCLSLALARSLSCSRSRSRSLPLSLSLSLALKRAPFGG